VQTKEDPALIGPGAIQEPTFLEESSPAMVEETQTGDKANLVQSLARVHAETQRNVVVLQMGREDKQSLFVKQVCSAPIAIDAGAIQVPTGRDASLLVNAVPTHRGVSANLRQPELPAAMSQEA